MRRVPDDGSRMPSCAARERRDALHLPGPRAHGRRAAARDQQQHRGGRQRAAQGHAQGPQGALDRAQDQGRLLVVLHALAGPAARRGVPTTTGSAAATARTPARRGCGRRPSCCLPTPRATSTTSPPALPARSWPPTSPSSGCPATRAGATRPTTPRARAFSAGSRSSSSTTGTGRAGRRALHRQALSVRVQVFERCTEEDGEPACQIVISPIGRKLVNLVFDQRDRESNDEERSRFVQWFAEDLGLSLTAKNREVGPSMHDGSSDELVGTC